MLSALSQERAVGERDDEPLLIRGVYPHLTTYAQNRPDGAFTLERHEECGIGAVVPWANRLWMINYAPHLPEGSEHSLYSVNQDLSMTIHPESVGGTPACRMIHRESQQLLIGPYLIDREGRVRVISPEVMPGRLTGIARHLQYPERMVYYYDMEGMVYEADVFTLEVRKLFHNPLPGWHGKGAYTGGGRFIVSNNGEDPYEKSADWAVAPSWRRKGAGVLAQWDGVNWEVVDRSQFTDVTGPGGLEGNSSEDDPVWAIGWDHRSLRLKVLHEGVWSTWLLPKAAHNNDPEHGWFTEWPRIREVNGGKWLMDMHGLFFEFPSAFRPGITAGIRPLGSHLRYIPDFADWNGRLVLATDETSIQGNPLAGQPQSAPWFGSLDDLRRKGPATAYGGPWVNDTLKAGTLSDPFHIAGYEKRVLHLQVHRLYGRSKNALRVTAEIDPDGKGQWEEWKVFSPEGYRQIAIPNQMKAEWIRFKVNRKCKMTAWFHLVNQNETEEDRTGIFGGLAAAGSVQYPSVEASDQPIYLYPNAVNRNLSIVLPVSEERYELTKTDFDVTAVEPDEGLESILKPELSYGFDRASAWVMQGRVKYRLPKQPIPVRQDTSRTDGSKEPQSGRSQFRVVREVESERLLANIHGTFYEVPLYKVGEPPLFHLMRPVSSHSFLIYDFSSWNGLLVMAATASETADQLIGSRVNGDVLLKRIPNTKSLLWMGAVDDLWQMGKPSGSGGPWFKTRVQSGAASDPYLMKGYEKKTIRIESDRDLQILMEIDYDHQSGWVEVMKFNVQAGIPYQTELEGSFSANWCRFISDKDAHITLQLDYNQE